MGYYNANTLYKLLETLRLSTMKNTCMVLNP